LNASASTLFSRGPMPAGPVTPVPETFGILPMAAETSASTRSGSAPTFCTIGRTMPSAASRSAFKRCSGSIVCDDASSAMPCAACNASVALMVSLSSLMSLSPYGRQAPGRIVSAPRAVIAPFKPVPSVS
jgi:hypothetical protein